MDPINPKHYKSSKNFEAIDVIEEATRDAPNGTLGVLQGNAIKYLYRLWRKENPKQDAAKAVWYLQRLIEHLTEDTPLEPHEALDRARGRKIRYNAVTAQNADEWNS